jgi:hypothetical protein
MHDKNERNLEENQRHSEETKIEWERKINEEWSEELYKET